MGGLPVQLHLQGKSIFIILTTAGVLAKFLTYLYSLLHSRVLFSAGGSQTPSTTCNSIIESWIYIGATCLSSLLHLPSVFSLLSPVPNTSLWKKNRSARSQGQNILTSQSRKILHDFWGKLPGRCRPERAQIASLPSSLGCRKTTQSTRVLQPDFPKRWVCGAKKGTSMSTAVRAEQDAQPLSWCVPWVAYRPGRVPARGCRYCWPDHTLPPPSHISPQS